VAPLLLKPFGRREVPRKRHADVYLVGLIEEPGRSPHNGQRVVGVALVRRGKTRINFIKTSQNKSMVRTGYRPPYMLGVRFARQRSTEDA